VIVNKPEYVRLWTETSYKVCSFVDAAARLALLDSNFAKLIGEAMEPPRSMDR
jgi:hypothetical protein